MTPVAGSITREREICRMHHHMHAHYALCMLINTHMEWASLRDYVISSAHVNWRNRTSLAQKLCVIPRSTAAAAPNHSRDCRQWDFHQNSDLARKVEPGHLAQYIPERTPPHSVRRGKWEPAAISVHQLMCARAAGHVCCALYDAELQCRGRR